MKMKPAQHVRAGDELDLEGCPFIQEEEDMITAMECYITVESVGPVEYDEMMMFELTDMEPIYVPADYRLKVIEGDD